MAAAAGAGISWRIERRGRVGSTNDEIVAAARMGAPEGLVIRADLQETGRGRQGRRWRSPPGNLYASLLLRPARPQADWPLLALLTGVALAGACESLAGVKIDLKWPNDLLMGGRKFAGILIESDGDGWLCVGTGVNVRAQPDDLDRLVTSLEAQGPAPEPGRLLAAYLARFAALYDRWAAGNAAPIAALWRQRAVGIGGPVRVRLRGGEVTGTALSIDGDGALVIRQGEQIRRILAGDVFFGDGES